MAEISGGKIEEQELAQAKELVLGVACRKEIGFDACKMGFGKIIGFIIVYLYAILGCLRLQMFKSIILDVMLGLLAFNFLRLASFFAFGGCRTLW